MCVSTAVKRIVPVSSSDGAPLRRGEAGALRGERRASAILLRPSASMSDRTPPTMPKLDPKALARQASDYLKRHPEEILRVLRGALSLRFGVPMDTVRYFAREFG